MDPSALPACFTESAFRTKAEYEASLALPDFERAAAERAAAEKATAARHGTAADLFNAMSLEQQRRVAPPPPPPPYDVVVIPEGTRVSISGLSSRPELNGTTATILSFVAEKARYAVKLPSGEKLRLKASNLQPPAHFKVRETERLMKAAGGCRLPVTVLSQHASALTAALGDRRVGERLWQRFRGRFTPRQHFAKIFGIFRAIVTHEFDATIAQAMACTYSCT